MYIFVSMDTKTMPNGKTAQGAELPTADVNQVEKWLTRDIGVAITLLTAIHNDPNLRRLMATHLHGLHENQKAKVDPRQSDLFNPNA